MKINKTYLILTIILFITEVLIAMFVHDRFVRPYVGDVLVVMLVYCFVRAFINSPPIPTAIGVLLFAFTIEFLQYLNIVKVLGLEQYSLARTVIGTSYSNIDLVAYFIGTVLTIATEAFWPKKVSTRKEVNQPSSNT